MKKKLFIALVCIACTVVLFVGFTNNKPTDRFQEGPAGTEFLLARADKALVLAEIVKSAGDSNVEGLDEESKEIVQTILQEVESKRQQLFNVRIKVSPAADTKLLQDLEEKVIALENELAPLVH